MNIENLEVGKIYKNYKVMCEALGVNIEAGNSKKAQLKEWERYFEYTKQGNKFIINTIYDEPKEKQDFRNGGNNKVKYIDKIEKLILDLLVQDENNGHVFLSKNKLLQTLKMVNENYSYGKYKPQKLSKYTNVKKEEISDFYEISDDMLQRNLEAALKNLRNKALIVWKTSLTIGYIETYVPLNEDAEVKATRKQVMDSNGDIEYVYDVAQPAKRMVHQKANEIEEKLIIHTEKEVLNTFGFKAIKDVFRYNKSEEFYKRVQSILFEKHNIYLYYNSYEITFNYDHILEEWEEFEEKLKLLQEEKESTQKELNQNIIDKLNDNAENRHIKAPVKFDETKKLKYEIRKSDEYLPNYDKLLETLINLNTPSMLKVEQV